MSDLREGSPPAEGSKTLTPALSRRRARGRLPTAVRSGAALFVAAFLLSLSIRLTTLGHLALWLDEVTTADVIALDWPALVRDRLANGHFPTYFALLKMLGLAGGSEFALRLPSAVADSVAGSLVALIGRRLDGWAGAIAAMLLYALMPNLIQYGQEARPYALMLLFVVIAMAAQTALIQGTARPRLQAAIATIGTLGTSFAIPAGIVAVATQHLALLFVPVRRMAKSIKRAFALHVGATWVAILIGMAILIPAVRKQAATPAGLLKWQSHIPFAARASEAFGETFGLVVPHDGDRFFPADGNEWLAAVLLLLVALGLLANRKSAAHRALGVSVIATPMIFALIGIFTATAGRYMLGMMPAVVLLAAAGVRRLLDRKRLRIPAAVILLVCLTGLSLQAADALTSERKYDWRRIATFLRDSDVHDVEILSDTPQTGPILHHYLPPGSGIGVATIDPDHEPIASLWSRAADRPVIWAVITAYRDPPDDLTEGATVCTWPFGEMKLVAIAKPNGSLPPRLKTCAAG